MKLPIYQVDAFTDTLFSGNPAAVVPLSEWLPDALMQQIARENNLAETAFFVPVAAAHYHIRWFTPTVEVALCGHATLAAAHVIFTELQTEQATALTFDSQSGPLYVSRDADRLVLDFPVDTLQVAVPPPALHECLRGVVPKQVLKGKTDYLVVLDSEAEVRELAPDIIVLSTIPARGIIVTAVGEQSDFVSRFFAPQSGVDEDPVTGSAHTTLVPYWAEQLGKTTLHARQLSERGGELFCELRGERVLLGGHTRLYMTGEILTA
jgi:PhzF family phenazine biosynthesis protein